MTDQSTAHARTHNTRRRTSYTEDTMKRLMLVSMVLVIMLLAFAPAFAQPATQPTPAVALVEPDELCPYSIWYRPTCDRGPQAR